MVVVALAGIAVAVIQRGRRPQAPSAGDYHDHEESCDWALYLNGKKIRPARGCECCVYKIEIISTQKPDDVVLKGRQDVDSAQGGRLRLPDAVAQAGGTWMEATASTQSGPTGTLDWMQYQGGGSSPDDAGASGDQGRQVRTLEEGPDVAAHLSFAEDTKITIELDSGCRDDTGTASEVFFVADVKSDVYITAKQTCTNRDTEPTCRVELMAEGSVEAGTYGDLIVNAKCDTERAGPDDPDLPGGRLGDNHEHGEHEFPAMERDANGKDTASFTGSRFQVGLWHETLLDAGLIVPVETWDTTDRVASHLASGTSHFLDIKGKPSGSCADEQCCVHGAGGKTKGGDCLCYTANFDLYLSPGGTTLKTDDFEVPLTRPDGGGKWSVSASDGPGTA